MSEPYPIIFLGESGVGKTSIIKLLTNGKFDPNEKPSFAPKFVRKTFEFFDKSVFHNDIWDNAGEYKYRSLSTVYLKNAKAVILVYNVTDEKSFIELKDYWYDLAKQKTHKDTVFAVVANKSDLYGQKQVANETGEEFAKKIGALFFSTSAKDDSSFDDFIRTINLKIEDAHTNKLNKGNEDLDIEDNA